MGILNVEHPEPDQFNRQDEIFLETLAIHVAGAIKRLKELQEYLRAQEKLIEEHVKLERAQEMDEIKTRFISTATHEIRTPLTSIRGYTEIISDTLLETVNEKTLD